MTDKKRTAEKDEPGREIQQLRWALNLTQRAAIRAVGSDPLSRTAKFVRVEVGSVHNPRLIPVSFAVELVQRKGPRKPLGSFSLFPPNNPGVFLVATGGTLREGGSVIVTLVPLTAIDADASVAVTIDSIVFVDS